MIGEKGWSSSPSPKILGSGSLAMRKVCSVAWSLAVTRATGTVCRPCREGCVIVFVRGNEGFCVGGILRRWGTANFEFGGMSCVRILPLTRKCFLVGGSERGAEKSTISYVSRAKCQCSLPCLKPCVLFNARCRRHTRRPCPLHPVPLVAPRSFALETKVV